MEWSEKEPGLEFSLYYNVIVRTIHLSLEAALHTANCTAASCMYSAFQVGNREKLKYTEDHFNINLELQDEVPIHSIASVIVASVMSSVIVATSVYLFKYGFCYSSKLPIPHEIHCKQ